MHPKRGSAIGQILIDESSVAHQVVFNGKPLTDESIGLSPLPSPLPQRFESRIVTHVDQPVARVERGLQKMASKLRIFESQRSWHRIIARLYKSESPRSGSNRNRPQNSA